MRFTFLALMLIGCTASSLKAEDPVWGKQQCAHCAMLVSEKPPAAQLVASDGKRRFFDDLGCMVSFEEREHPNVVGRWVRDPRGDGWVDPATIHFSGGHKTPMDFGFLPDAQGVASYDVIRGVILKKREGE